MKPHATALAAALIVAAVAGPAISAEPFDEAELFLELNDTDGDLGLHALIDGESWKLLEIEDPQGNTILSVLPDSQLGEHGMTELSFESAEPSFDELPPEQFFELFPEGEYGISGITVEDEELESTAELSHVLPAPPEKIRVGGKRAAEDCDAVLPRVSKPVLIRWTQVTDSHPDIGETGPVEVEKYEVVVELLTSPNSKFSMDLPPDITRFVVPSELLKQGQDFKFEIVTRATNHNQTAVESCFILK
jgi:hypothetical protein